MGLYPLAIYTAEHGLNWKYPRSEIDFASLDGCRKAFGGLPDFDAGEAGFEGIWITPDRVFAMRCQSVPGWDFRGRDATYLAVTWVTREDAASTDFEALLADSVLAEPTHAPQAFFEAEADGQTQSPLSAIPTKMSDFVSVGALVAALPATASATLRRSAPGESVQVKTSFPHVSHDVGKIPTLKRPSQTNSIRVATTHSVPKSSKTPSIGVTITIACAITTLLALAALGWTIWQWQSTKRTLETLTEEYATVQKERDALVIELEQTRNALQEMNAEQNGATKAKPSVAPDKDVETPKNQPKGIDKVVPDRKETNSANNAQSKHLDSPFSQRQGRDLVMERLSLPQMQNNRMQRTPIPTARKDKEGDHE